MIIEDFCVHTDNKASHFGADHRTSAWPANDIIAVIATFPDELHVEVTFNM